MDFENLENVLWRTRVLMWKYKEGVCNTNDYQGLIELRGNFII